MQMRQMSKHKKRLSFPNLVSLFQLGRLAVNRVVWRWKTSNELPMTNNNNLVDNQFPANYCQLPEPVLSAIVAL